MTFPEQYRVALRSTLDAIELGKVQRVIDVFKHAGTERRRIFVCCTGVSSSIASTLVDLIMGGGFRSGSRFRIMALHDQSLAGTIKPGDPPQERLLLERLKSFAEVGDVFMGIVHSGELRNMLPLLEYATWIGCETVVLSSAGEDELDRLAQVNVRVIAPHPYCMEDAFVIICHMIAYYFVNSEREANDQRT